MISGGTGSSAIPIKDLKLDSELYRKLTKISYSQEVSIEKLVNQMLQEHVKMSELLKQGFVLTHKQSIKMFTESVSDETIKNAAERLSTVIKELVILSSGSVKPILLDHFNLIRSFSQINDYGLDIVTNPDSSILFVLSHGLGRKYGLYLGECIKIAVEGIAPVSEMQVTDSVLYIKSVPLDIKNSLQRTAKVLVVEDDNDILLIFKKALETDGYTVRAFSNPNDALEHFRANPSLYDLVLTDIRMDNMTGFELARRLKDLNPEILILFTTAYELTRNEIEKELVPLLYPVPAAQGGIIKKESALIIPKPAKLEKIVASVKEVLSDYSSLSNPSDNEHIVILYSDKNDQDQYNYHDVISEYINAGLARNQLCIYTYIEKDEETATAELSKRITNYKENVEAGNLLLVDFKPFCSSAIDNNLKPFEELMQIAKEKTRDRSDKHVRLVGRASGWLYENKYFNQCLALERWWHTKPFHGSLVHPYKMSLFEHKEFFEYQNSLFIRHDTVLKI